MDINVTEAGLDCHEHVIFSNSCKRISHGI